MTFRDFATGISLANIVLLRAWFLAGGSAYFFSQLPLNRWYAGLLIDFGLLALFLAGLSAWSRHRPGGLRIAALVIGGLLLPPLDWLLRHGAGVVLSDVPMPAGETGAWIVGGLAVAVLTLLRPLQLFLLRVLPIVALPLVLVTVPFSLMPFFATPHAAQPAAADAPRQAGAKVLWLLFDSLNQDTLTGAPGQVPALPAFRQLMAESFVATAATSPGSRTLTAIPSMTIGRIVTSASADGHALSLRFADGGSGPWHEQDTVFHAVKRMGYATGAAGWYHPYCDVFGGLLDHCAWSPMDPPVDGIRAGMRRHAQSALGALSLVYRAGLDEVLLSASQIEWTRAQHLAALGHIAGRTEAIALAMPAGLLLAHYPVPHEPAIGDLVSPGTGDWTGFYGNAILADRAFASLRRRLEAEGEWDDATVLVTADHVSEAMAARGHEVPFIVKFSGASRPLVYTAPVSLVVLRDLLPRIVAREITTAEQLASYLSSRPARP